MHSRHSRPCRLGRLRAASGPGTPEEIDRAARGRGMDLVTLTDRDTIDGCLAYLDRHPSASHFFISEEITARDPRHGARLQVLMYGISEAQHRELARRRDDIRDLLSYAGDEEIPASAGSWSGAWRGAPPESFVRETLGLFDLFEVINGAFSPAHAAMTLRLAHEARGPLGFGVTAGSGAHGPARAGRTGTAGEAASPAGFIAALRDRRTSFVGESGSRWASVADLCRVLGERPLALRAPTILRHGLERARLAARLRLGHRRLDRLDLHRFQERTRSYRSTASGMEADSTSITTLE